MNLLKMDRFGTILTGRPFGKKVMEELRPNLKYPVILDFERVLSLGSSFGDEVVAVIAKNQNCEISVRNANKAVEACLFQMAADHEIKIVVVV